MDTYDLEKVIDEMMKAAPAFLTRKQVQEITRGMFNARTLSNLDSLGLGITPRLKLGGKVVYPHAAVRAFWLKQLKVLDS